MVNVFLDIHGFLRRPASIKYDESVNWESKSINCPHMRNCTQSQLHIQIQQRVVSPIKVNHITSMMDMLKNNK